MDSYVIRKTAGEIDPAADWDASVWDGAEAALIGNVWHTSTHTPEVWVKLMYSDKGFHCMFLVNDKYVRSVNRGYNQSVCLDSCVEFFFQPFGAGPYFNFEFNCGGAVLASYIRDWTRVDGKGFADFTMLKDSELDQLNIFHSMPETVEPEMSGDIQWRLGFFLPFAVLENYTGALGDLTGTRWRANFYKCGDKTSHPHWLSWRPVSTLNFHQPECFGVIEFEQSGKPDGQQMRQVY
eukprot:TRINITY_DN15111_c0_g1_i2.p1 TRINITY_DN15111_c0_g1~~TRINITY_DN15111_c0_g1_i2.p1  ORF type:complete len:237 (-),score=24.92 TRINITY_DN15111_c0_g1_i2:244-954(-)